MLSHPEIKEVLYKSLKELGLSGQEVNLYTLSLSLGPVSIATLAEALHISRPNVYKLINGLEQVGLASFSQKKSYAKTFMVEPPSVVVDLVRQKKEHLNRMDREMVTAMPDLLALYRQGELPTSIQMFEGKEMFRKTLEMIKEQAKGQIEMFGSFQDLVGFITWDTQQDFVSYRIKNNIKVKALLLSSKDTEELIKNDAKQLRETRILKTTQPFLSSFQLFANKVVIWQPKAPLAILISDEYIVQMLRSIFNSLWEVNQNE